MGALAALGAAMAAVLALTACDPCSGVARCANGAYLAASGWIVDSAQGNGIDGVRIDVVRTGGIAVGTDSVSAVTRDGGFWRVQFDPQAPGTLVADVEVSPPGAAPYRLHNVRLDTKEHEGDANLNERWTTYLYFNYFGEFYLRGTNDQRVEGAIVEFHRTGGLVPYGPGLPGDVYTAATDWAGRVSLFPSSGGQAVLAHEDGVLTGDLTVRLPDGSASTTLTGVGLVPSHHYRDPREFPPIIRDAVGP